MVDDDTNIVDEILWSSKRSVGALTNRLEKLQSGALSPEARTLADRFPDALPDSMAALSDPQWPDLDDDENTILSAASARLAKRGVANSATDPDRRLDMLSGATSELRTAWGTSESRCVEWAGLFLPDADLEGQRAEFPTALADADSIVAAAASLGLQTPIHLPSGQEWDALRAHARSVIELADRLDSAEEATRALAQQHVPTLSLLIGPLGAAKMLTLAGGRERLARMPSGSLQVLGASGAMAAHRRGAPPPKHSPILFSLPQVSKAPRWVRGKIARYIAGKCSIAVRVDHFNGEPWGDEQINEINQECQKIKDRFPKPPKRR